MPPAMRVIGIETSCDDTAIGIVRLEQGRITIESRVAASQVLIHRRYGGVVPEVAAREHALTILPTIQAALAQAKRGWGDIDALAVTGGPGLSTALSVGVEAARTIAYALGKPVARVNHIEGHIMSAWAGSPSPHIRFPVLALVVSGGHTELILMKRFGAYKLLGRTIDDAVGEAFDKSAKILGLPYPGGPSISQAASRGDSSAFRFPRSMLGKTSLDFSYAGLKTAVLYEAARHRRLTPALVHDLAASFQMAAVAPLIEKTRRALIVTHAPTLVVAGGVAANSLLRERLGRMVKDEFPKITFIRAPLELCGDNGVMIAIAGAYHAQRGEYLPWKRLTADPNWELV